MRITRECPLSHQTLSPQVVAALERWSGMRGAPLTVGDVLDLVENGQVAQVCGDAVEEVRRVLLEAGFGHVHLDGLHVAAHLEALEALRELDSRLRKGGFATLLRQAECPPLLVASDPNGPLKGLVESVSLEPRLYLDSGRSRSERAYMGGTAGRLACRDDPDGAVKRLAWWLRERWLASRTVGGVGAKNASRSGKTQVRRGR